MVAGSRAGGGDGETETLSLMSEPPRVDFPATTRAIAARVAELELRREPGER